MLTRNLWNQISTLWKSRTGCMSLISNLQLKKSNCRKNIWIWKIRWIWHSNRKYQKRMRKLRPNIRLGNISLINGLIYMMKGNKDWWRRLMCLLILKSTTKTNMLIHFSQIMTRRSLPLKGMGIWNHWKRIVYQLSLPLVLLGHRDLSRKRWKNKFKKKKSLNTFRF